VAYETKEQQRERFIAEFFGAYVKHLQAHGSICASATCSRTPMLSALTNCGPLARPHYFATITMMRGKRRTGDPAPMAASVVDIDAFDAAFQVPAIAGLHSAEEKS
jgi:hypothetical protein